MLAMMKRLSIGAGLILSLNAPFFAQAFAAPASQGISTAGPATPEFRPGDLVRLRSGGSLMTVDTVKDDQVDCFWTDGSGQTNNATFPVQVLRKF
ncbi:DUF2158 domain-containing protein [Bradyrhizobium sp. Leo121]|uniref:DUF2158 domain-containing protein n=1 Tax=Bradyrhizobium sp. Leo121 TaxID=1571195 RepID=UPI00102A5CCB|nr:DUF2158 domain-containing protein [Bradyrhizobium sp. Leo121]RZN31553.1 hypothetical protein CWO90_16325 [Bradyrhizobium sp. Leo121]